MDALVVLYILYSVHVHSTTVLYVLIANWWATTQLLIILTSRTFRAVGLCQLIARHQLWASTTSQLSHSATSPPLLPSSQSAHPQRLSAEEAHRALKNDIPSGTSPTTFTNLFENMENLKTLAVDVSKAMPLTQITTMLLSWEAVHTKWVPYTFCVKSVLFLVSAATTAQAIKPERGCSYPTSYHYVSSSPSPHTYSCISYSSPN